MYTCWVQTGAGAMPDSGPPSRSFAPGALTAAALVGTVVALITIPAWVPTLAASISGTEPKLFWYLSRASGFVSFALLWLSMASGLIITYTMARVWPATFTAFDLHQYTSLLGLVFAFFHVIILLGNQYVPYNLVQLFVPFVDAPYRPFWIALGQIGLYLSILVTFTFYIRKQMGNRLWHIIHYLSYPVLRRQPCCTACSAAQTAAMCGYSRCTGRVRPACSRSPCTA